MSYKKNVMLVSSEQGCMCQALAFRSKIIRKEGKCGKRSKPKVALTGPALTQTPLHFPIRTFCAKLLGKVARMNDDAPQKQMVFEPVCMYMRSRAWTAHGQECLGKAVSSLCLGETQTRWLIPYQLMASENASSSKNKNHQPN